MISKPKPFSPEQIELIRSVVKEILARLINISSEKMSEERDYVVKYIETFIKDELEELDEENK